MPRGAHGPALCYWPMRRPPRERRVQKCGLQAPDDLRGAPESAAVCEHLGSISADVHRNARCYLGEDNSTEASVIQMLRQAVIWRARNREWQMFLIGQCNNHPNATQRHVYMCREGAPVEDVEISIRARFLLYLFLIHPRPPHLLLGHKLENVAEPRHPLGQRQQVEIRLVTQPVLGLFRARGKLQMCGRLVETMLVLGTDAAALMLQHLECSNKTEQCAVAPKVGQAPEAMHSLRNACDDGVDARLLRKEVLRIPYRRRIKRNEGTQRYLQVCTSTCAMSMRSTLCLLYDVHSQMPATESGMAAVRALVACRLHCA